MTEVRDQDKSYFNISSGKCQENHAIPKSEVALIDKLTSEVGRLTTAKLSIKIILATCKRSKTNGLVVFKSLISKVIFFFNDSSVKHINKEMVMGIDSSRWLQTGTTEIQPGGFVHLRRPA